MNSSSDLFALLTAARGGSSTAADSLLATVRPYLLLLAAQELPSDVRAKTAPSDVVQDTLLAAHRGLAGFNGTTEAALLAWLRQILVHQATNAVNRYRRVAGRAVGREVAIDDSRGNPGLRDGLAGPAGTPSGDARRLEEVQAVRDAIDRLAEDDRRVILLRHQDYLGFAEIARRLDRSEDATRQLYCRAVNRLQREVRGPDEHAAPG